MELSFYIPYEDYDIEDIKGYPGDYDWDYEDGPFFEEILEEVLLDRVGNQLALIEDLLSAGNVNNITIGADIIGIEGVEARCIRRSGDDGQVYASITLGPHMIYHYLKAYWDPQYQVPLAKDLTIIHELVHVLDQDIYDHLNLGEAVGDPLVQFFQWLSQFRTEGMAELPLYLAGEAGCDNPETIRLRLNKMIKELLTGFQVHGSLPVKSYDGKKDLIHAPYELGPWLVADLIAKKSGLTLSKSKVRLLEQLEEFKAALKVGLAVSIEEFLDHILDLKFGEEYLMNRSLFVEILSSCLIASEAYWLGQESEDPEGVQKLRQFAKYLISKAESMG